MKQTRVSDSSRGTRGVLALSLPALLALPLAFAAMPAAGPAERIQSDGPVTAFDLDMTGDLRFAVEGGRSATWYHVPPTLDRVVDVHQLAMDVLRWSKSDGFRVVAVGEADDVRTGESSAEAIPLISLSVGLGR